VEGYNGDLEGEFGEGMRVLRGSEESEAGVCRRRRQRRKKWHFWV